MKIKGLFNLSSTDHKNFTDNNGQIVYSALLIGSE